MDRKTITVAATLLLFASARADAQEQICPPAQQYCPPVQQYCPPGSSIIAPAPGTPATPGTTDSAVTPAAPTAPDAVGSPVDTGSVPQNQSMFNQPPAQNLFQNTPPTSTQPSSQLSLASSGNDSLAPNMIGDYFGAPAGGFLSSFALLNPPIGDNFHVSANASALVGRQKIADNSSPLPRDRIFISYSHYDDVALTNSGLSVDRYTFGYEKTFLEGDASIEFRLPFANTLDSGDVFGGGTATELGDLVIYLKALLYDTPTSAYSAGLGVTLPTTSDLAQAGEPDFRVNHKSVHLMPFLGAVKTNGDFFIQGYAQLDFDVNGDSIETPAQTARSQDATYLYLDLGLGFWLHRSNSGMIRGIAPTAEIHYNRSLQPSDPLLIGGDPLAPEFRQFDAVQNINAIVGVTMLVGENGSLTLGYGTPIGNKEDRGFSGEFRVVFNLFLNQGRNNGSFARGRNARLFTQGR